MATAFRLLIALLSLVASTPSIADQPATEEARLEQLARDMKTLETRKQRGDDEAYDRAKWVNFVLGIAQLNGVFGYTDNDGVSRTGDGVPIQLKDTQIANARIGYFGKPLARDIRFLLGGVDAMAKYRSEGKADPRRLFFWDAVKVDAHIGYGDVVKEQDGSDDEETERAVFRFIGVRYELPLERVLCSTPWEALCGRPWQ